LVGRTFVLFVVVVGVVMVECSGRARAPQALLKNKTAPSNNELISQRCHCLNFAPLPYHSAWSGLSWLSLQHREWLVVGFGFRVKPLVLLHATEELGSTGRRRDVFDTYVDSFPDDAVADGFVDFDADGAGGNIPDDAGLPVVELVRHPLVDRPVRLDVHVVTGLVGRQVGRQLQHPLLSEAP